LGIDTPEPRLGWQLQSERRGARQTAYQVLVAGNQDDLLHERALLWDSGKALSDQSLHVPYGGQTLRSGQRAWWQVRAWDEQDQASDYSAPA
jgi:alpha-L-rhamnosidase